MALLDQLRIIVEPWFRESEVSVRWVIGASLPNVWAEKSGLLQIFLNLVQNSIKAMEATEQKQLTISGHVEVDTVSSAVPGYRSGRGGSRRIIPSLPGWHRRERPRPVHFTCNGAVILRRIEIRAHSDGLFLFG
jgi:signal transduction histidine kinase